MSKADYVTFALLVVLILRSVLQQIYIRRLKLAMLELVSALERSTGIRSGDKVRGHARKILP